MYSSNRSTVDVVSIQQDKNTFWTDTNKAYEKLPLEDRHELDAWDCTLQDGLEDEMSDDYEIKDILEFTLENTSLAIGVKYCTNKGGVVIYSGNGELCLTFNQLDRLRDLLRRLDAISHLSVD